MLGNKFKFKGVVMSFKGCFRVLRWLIIPVVISFIVFVYIRYIKPDVETVDTPPTGI